MVTTDARHTSVFLLSFCLQHTSSSEMPSIHRLYIIHKQRGALCPIHDVHKAESYVCQKDSILFFAFSFLFFLYVLLHSSTRSACAVRGTLLGADAPEQDMLLLCVYITKQSCNGAAWKGTLSVYREATTIAHCSSYVGD